MTRREAACRRPLAAAAGIAALAAALLLPNAFGAPLPARPLPADSIYQLAAALTDQDGRTDDWGSRRGRVTLVAMFYTSCQFVCPMLVDTLRDVASKLNDGERGRLSILLVSVDSAHDTVDALKRTALERGIAGPGWTLARADEATVRKVAAVLGIQYRALRNGEFNHTTAVILVDADGRMVTRSSKLGAADPAFLKRVKAELARGD